MNKTSRRIVMGLLVLGLAMSGGCGGGGDDEGTPDVTAQDTTQDTQGSEWCSPPCGNGFVCQNKQCVPENAQPVCGDGQCDTTETCTACQQDCGACPAGCPNGQCDGTETCGSCPDDCGTCPPECGDGLCNGSETCGTCAADCGACPPGCGDGQCNGTETCTTCKDDCGACPPECGDAQCNGTETCETCAGDCGACPPKCEPACTAGFHCDNGTCVPDQAGPCAKSGNVANLKSCSEGDVDVMLKNVTVTYVFDAGYFVQDDSGAMEVYVGNAWPYDAPVVGKVLDIHVTKYGNYKNQQEVTASDIPVGVGNGNVETMKLDITAGTLPAEALESRVIKGTGFTVTKVETKNITLDYGTAKGVMFRTDFPGPLCVGAKFDLATGVITQFENSHRLQSFFAQDMVNVVTTGCQAAPTFDSSNWGFEETAQNDPPADFEKATSDFTAMWTTAQKHAGNNGCDLTWTSQDNQDLFQGWFMPVTAGQNVTFTLWTIDNDTAGRFRLALEFFAADKSSVGKEYSSSYTTDNPAWIQLTYSFKAPANTAFVKGFVRLYDVAESWDANATVYIDDWSVTAQ